LYKKWTPVSNFLACGLVGVKIKFYLKLSDLKNNSTSGEPGKLDSRTIDLDGYIPVEIPDIMIGLTRYEPKPGETGAINIMKNSMYGAFTQDGRRSALVTGDNSKSLSMTESIFITKKPYIKQIIFEDETPKLNIKLEPLNLTDDKQDKQRNIDKIMVEYLVSNILYRR